VSVPMTLSDLERRVLRGKNYLADFHYYAGTVWPRMTQFGVVTQVGEAYISRGKPRLMLFLSLSET